MSEKSYQAIVEKVYKTGPHGPYAVARSKTIGSITFSLKPEIWKEEEWPDPGTYVVLDKVRLQRGGWRATVAHFVKP